MLKEYVYNMGQFLFWHSLLKLTVLWVADVEMRNVEMRNATIKQAQHVCRQFSRGAVLEVAEEYMQMYLSAEFLLLSTRDSMCRARNNWSPASKHQRPLCGSVHQICNY